MGRSTTSTAFSILLGVALAAGVTPAATMPFRLPSDASSGYLKDPNRIPEREQPLRRSRTGDEREPFGFPLISQSWPAKWQATKRPGSFISRGGSPSEQIFCAIGQRVWNRQAGGGLTGDGISPFRRIGFRAASRSGSGTGTELSSTLV